MTAIVMADLDNNAATTSDPSWTPVLATPNHPEYPAAHGCTGGSFGETLRRYYGTSQVVFTMDSTVTGTTRTFATTDALTDEAQLARIYGGMHFRHSTVDGAVLGKKVAEWVAQHHFGRRD